AYPYYRLNMTNNSGTILQLSEWEIMGIVGNTNTATPTRTSTPTPTSPASTSTPTPTTPVNLQDITNLSGTVSAQYYDSPSGEEIEKLIDNTTSTKYLTFHASGWVQFAGSSAVVTQYTISSANDAAERDPYTWTLQGSSNGSTWVTLDSRSGEDFPNRFQTRAFTFGNSNAYPYYRLNMTNNSGTILQLSEWEIFGAVNNTATSTSTPTRTPTPVQATATPTRSPTPVQNTPTPNQSGICFCSHDYALWNSCTIYLQGDRVHSCTTGHDYEANYWTQNNDPSVHNGNGEEWIDLGACSGSAGVIESVDSPGFPGKVFAPYVDVSISPTFSIYNCYQSTGQRYYTLAFILSSNGQAAWGGVQTLDCPFYLDEINRVRKAGGDVIISFGGANGTELATAITNVTTLTSEYQKVITMYKLKMIDFDIEGGAVTDKAGIDRRSQAMRNLQNANPGLKINLCLPVMPYGLTADGEYVVQSAKNAGVSINAVNVMAMDYGGANSAMGQAAIDAANSTRSQTGCNIGITPMIGQNDSQGEIFTLSNASEVLNFGNNTSWVVLLAFWSVGRDNGDCAGQSYASPICSGVSQSLFEYTNTFKPFSR
ncbi:MAG: hypothetical protein JW969_01200, partial [Spirochaetales bacterium]|nr:hypothetical protein [Spirochaetales bacterium]